MITGLEIGAIVVGCVNAGLSAAKLVRDWYEKRKERKQEGKNVKLEESLRSDASSIQSAYQYHLRQIQKHDQRRFEIGDELSRSEINPSGQRLQTALRDLRAKITKSKGKVIPDLTRFMATSNDAQLAIVEALARLHRRIVYETRVPRSLNPLKMFGFGGSKTGKLQKKGSPSASSSGRVSGSLPSSSSRATLIAPRSSSSTTAVPSAAGSVPDLLNLFPANAPPAMPASSPVFPQLPWDFDGRPPAATAVTVHAATCPCAGHSPRCTCVGSQQHQHQHQQVVFVDRMYVTNKPPAHVSSSRPRKPAAKTRSKPVETEIVLVRRPVRSRDR